MSKKRRKFSAEFKFDTVIEGLRGEKSIAQICRERNITESLHYKWKQAFIEQAPKIFEDKRGATQDDQAYQVAELEQMVGRLTMEVAILKKARSWLDTQRGKSGP